MGIGNFNGNSVKVVDYQENLMIILHRCIRNV